MIQVIITHDCPDCGRANLVKNGQDYQGDQKFRCNDCGRCGTFDTTGRYTPERQAEILRAYQERSSMRGIQRTFGVARTTLARWLKQTAATQPTVAETLDAVRGDNVLELDELWSFVTSKDNQRWVWIAFCRRTRQVVAFFSGDRSAASCRKLWARLPDAYRNCRTFSDFWNAYQNVFVTGNHRSVGKESGETHHVERWNNTLRQRLARFVRKTLSFSKSDFYHELVLRLFIIRYNLECVS
ncbi:MAG: IS1 family transposase [Thermoflexales bacterium]|nr:IS1 family transposase [Thermoflexales bacterium]